MWMGVCMNVTKAQDSEVGVLYVDGCVYECEKGSRYCGWCTVCGWVCG